MLPNLFIVGAQKSGTTSLHYLLESHREIFFPRRPQEIHYFDIEENYRRGADWFESCFDDWQGEAYCAQTSPLYMYEPVVAERMQALVPGARSIFILRNPIDRAYSHYWHEVRYGYEELPFRGALEAESSRLRGGFTARRHFSYLDRGRYSVQIRRFQEKFPGDQLLFLLQDELKSSPQQVKEKVAGFLAVDLEGFEVKPQERWHFNRTGMPRIRSLQRWRRRCAKKLPWVAFAIDQVNLVDRRYPPMKSQDRQWLQERFAQEIEDLGRLTGLPVGSWLD
ncbi:MAG: sulfotransferase domain-containing protein [Deltaproteobacteria bacterium]|nr:sulfotransferase domain-containing protein [Deltaproteobacteria bacterium]